MGDRQKAASLSISGMNGRSAAARGTIDKGVGTPLEGRAGRPSSLASHQRASDFVVKGVPAREFVVPLVAATVVLLMALRFAGELPDPVASAWDPDGSPVDSNHRLIELVTGVAVTGASAVVPLLLTVRVRRPVGQRLLVVAAHVLPVLFAGHRWRLVEANRGAPSWDLATSAAEPSVVYALAVAAALWGWWASRDRGYGDGVAERGGSGNRPG